MTDGVDFKLTDEFLSQYKGKQPKWGYNGLGYTVYRRTYSRQTDNGKYEEYWQTVKRVVEGIFKIQKQHCQKNKLPWNGKKAQTSAQKMYDLIWNFKFSPSGRGLWAMGTDMLDKKGSACLFNCSFVSTDNLNIDFSEPFCFLMDMSMLGVGVGSDTKGASKVVIKQPEYTFDTFVVDDSREGWVSLLKVLLDSYVGLCKQPKSIDYSKIRKKGEALKGMGGVASGPDPLIEMFNDIKELLDSRVGQKVSSSDIVDIFNMVGKCVVAGGIRRSAEIMLGSPDDEEFLNLKNPKTNKKALYHHRWVSNNSVTVKVGSDYSKVAELTAMNGEPGYIWIDNSKKYSRMNGVIDNKDYRVAGTNPCGEIALESFEECNLVETYPANHETLEEWFETLKYAYMYSKTVTLIPCHNEKANAVMMRNRRIGCSMSGITQAFKKFGKRNFINSCKDGYDKIQEYDKLLSEWLCVPRSIKTTTIKPSGSISLLCGASPGVHYPLAEYYLRNVRFQKGSTLLKELQEAGYKCEEDKYDTSAIVVSFPVKEEHFEKAVKDVTMWEQLENVAQLQEAWADNQISATVSFSEEEAKDIKNALELYETRLKSVSFLPKSEHGYEQAPYVPITKEQYDKEVEKLKKLKIKEAEHEVTEKYCDGDVCMMKKV